MPGGCGEVCCGAPCVRLAAAPEVRPAQRERVVNTGGGGSQQQVQVRGTRRFSCPSWDLSPFAKHREWEGRQASTHG